MRTPHRYFVDVSSRLTSTIRCGIILAFAALLLPSGHGASKFWDGSSSGNFNNANNWTPSGVPAAGDDLVFQAGITQLLVTNDFSPNRAWSSILFQGSNYFVRGNAILVTNGISSLNPSGPNHVDADVDVRASQAWEASGSLGVLDINGDINLNANTLTVRANTGDFFFSGIISGTGSLVKTNVGTLRLDGSGHNTYSGVTRFDGGVLELSKFSIFPTFTNFTAIPGDLIVGDGNNIVGSDVLRLLTDDQIADTSHVTVKNSGLMDLNDQNDRIGALTLQGGDIETGTGLLTLGGNVNTIGDNSIAVIGGSLSLGGSSRAFDIDSGGASPDLRVTASISPGTTIFAMAGIIKNGGGTLEFGGTNTYNGTTTINDGQLAITTDGALGATLSIFGTPVGTVINGDANLFLSNVQVTNETLTINAVNAGGDFNCSGASVWTGDILLNSATFLGGSGNLLLSGTITGLGGFTKIGAGTVTIGGTNANTYTGTTIVQDGTLLLDKDEFDGAMSGPLIIGEDELPENADVVRLLRASQLPDDTDITINSSGLLDLNGFGENVRNLIFNGGDVDAPSPGSILPTGDITVNANANSQAIISGRLSVLSNPIIDVTGHFFSPDLSITAILFGGGGFAKNGIGEVGLSGVNTYTGLTTVNDGFVLVNDSSALGTTANGTIVNAGAVLALMFGVAIPAEALTLAGTGQSSFGALSSSFGANSWAGSITLSADTLITVDSGDSLNLSGSISGAHTLTKGGTGVLTFSGNTANTYGGTILTSGTLVLNKTIANSSIPGALTIGDGSGTDILRLDLDNQIADGSAITINSGGRLDLNGMVDTTGRISGGGSIDLGSGVLREGADNGSATYSGTIFGTGSLFKLGTGTWTLTANNSYSGQTTVSAGTLVVDGDQRQSAVTVNGTATLMGSGVIGNLQVFGTIRPGASPGILTSSNVNFDAQGDYFVELNGPNPGTGYDQLNVRGTNQLGSSTLHVSVGAGFAPSDGQEFVILNNDGSDGIFGTFAGLPNNSLVSAGPHQFRIRYSAIFENDVVLTYTNTHARLLGATVTGGNGNAAIDINECNFLSVVITNTEGAILTGVSATLVPKTPGVCVTFGTSAYPNIPVNGRGTNSTLFQFSTSPAFLCGTNVEFDLVVTTAAVGSFTIPISMASGSAGVPIRISNNVSAGIPDNGSFDFLLPVSGITTPIRRIEVSVHITHTAAGDLDLTLIGPDGTTVNLSSDNGGTSDDYGTDCGEANRTFFTDLSPTPITASTAPFAGSFRPEQPLSIFNDKFGAAVNGTWTLRVADDTAGGIGTLRCWSLFVTPTACANAGGGCESCPEDRVIRGVLGVGSLVQTNRLSRDGTPSVCGVFNACPGDFGTVANRFYDAYIIQNGESNACVTITLQAECDLFSAAYTNAYLPPNLCLNYFADMGNSTVALGGSGSYSLNMRAGARFVIVVHGVNTADACPYTLTVDGGSCRPRLRITQIAPHQYDLHWTTAAIGYGLERTNVLFDPPHPLWVPVSSPLPTISGGEFHVIHTNPPPRTNNFFQLRKP